MRILTTCFYADFSRYFNYLEKEIEKVIKDVEFFNISIYPSAHYQWKLYNRHSILLPQYVLKNIKYKIVNISIPKVYKDINLDEIISFSYKTQIMFNRDNSIELKKQAIRYIDYFDELFYSNHFDLYISSGDSRMLIKIADHFAKKYNITTFYFEQGPFGTTIIDSKGVNCNISFIDRKENDFIKDIDKEKLYNYIHNYYENKPSNYWKNSKKSIMRNYTNLLTFLYMYPPKLLFFYFPIDLQMGSSFWDNKKQQIIDKINKKFKQKKLHNDSLIPDKFITFIMQMPTDAQLIENSPIYKSFDEMITDIYNSLPYGYKFIVREHPHYRGKYNKFIYDFINQHNDIYLRNDDPLDELIKKSDLIILNNSTVGIEALSFYKTVVTLGNAYYNRKGITYNLEQKSELKELLLYAINNPIKKHNIDIFLYNFLYNYLYIGHFQDAELQSGDIIVKNMLKGMCIE